MKKRIALLVWSLATLSMASGAHALGTTRFAVQSTGGVDMATIQDNGYIAVGHNNPLGAIHAKGTTTVSSQLFLHNNASVSTSGGGGGVLLYYNGATNSLPAPGDRLGYIYFGAMDGANSRPSAGIRGFADGTWTTNVSAPSGFLFETVPATGLTRYERMRISAAGNVGINTTSPTSKLSVVGLQICPNNTTAKAALANGCGGLTAGAIYIVGAVAVPPATTGTPTLTSGNATLAIVY